MNVAIYARVSTETQAKDGTIQSQIEALKEYARDNDLNVIHEYIDDGFSGSDLNRPNLDRMRDQAAEGLFDAILVLSPDRLARKQAHQIILTEEFKKRGIKIIFSNFSYEENAQGRFMLNIQGAIAEYEREVILDRTRRGILHAARNGQVIGSNPPYGYKYVPKTNTTPATYDIDPQEAEIVRMIFDWYVKEGMKGTAIAKRLEDEGIPSRSGYDKWWSTTIYTILKNETYTGIAYMNKTKRVEPKKHPKLSQYRKHRKSSKADRPRSEWIGIPVPALIEESTWKAAQNLLKRNAKKSSLNNKKNKYLLRNLVVCGLCGSMAPGYVSNKNTYYSCRAKRGKNLTTKPHDERVMIKHTLLDERVWAGLVQLLDDPENLRTQLKAKIQRSADLPIQDNKQLDQIEKELETLLKKETRIIDAYRESVIDLDELKEQKSKIKKRAQILEAKKKAALNRLEGSGQLEITDTILDDLSARYQRVMAQADFKTKTKLANLLINRVSLYQDRAIVKGNIPVVENDALITSHLDAPRFLSLP